jgi:hypothetical protein
MHVIIPTRHKEPTDLILRNAEFHFRNFGLQTILIPMSYGRHFGLIINDFLTSVPFTTSSVLMNIATETNPITNDIIFGRNIQNLGFGGSSNLVQLIGITLGLDRWLKIDDDCRITSFADGSFLPSGSVGIGKLEEISPHPKDLLIRKHPDLAEQTRLDSTGAPFPVRFLKNGALLMSRGAAVLAPYPVLFSGRAGLSLRGEVYDWARRILESGGAFFEHKTFVLQHYRQSWNKDAWITQMLLKSDIVFLHRASDLGGLIRPDTRNRANNLTLICEAVEALDPSEFNPTLDLQEIQHEALYLSDKSLIESQIAVAHWRNICQRSTALRDEWRRRDDVVSALLHRI